MFTITLLFQIADAVAGEFLQLILHAVDTAEVPLVSGQTHSEDAALETGGRFKVHDTSTAIVYYVVPRTQNSRVGGILPRLYHLRTSLKTLGVQVPHPIMVALHTRTLEAVDTCKERRLVGHAPIDGVLAVVVDLTFDITDDRMHTPDVGIVVTLTIA